VTGAADPPRREVRVTTAITAEPLEPSAALAAVADSEAGGIGLFVGVVRDHHEGAAVSGLDYEAWEGRAEDELRRVADEVAATFPGVRAVHAVHRVGSLGIGDPSVVVAVSAPHRDEALEATRVLIDRLKDEVPIWKHEHLVDGSSRWPGTDTPR
jgi:molybdopterin synthase catalytic subunit